MAVGRKTGGRAKGVPNKVTSDVKLAAREYTTEALETLAHIMRAGESEAARVAAVRELLDRAWGKPQQPLTGADDTPLFPHITVTFGDSGDAEAG